MSGKAWQGRFFSIWAGQQISLIGSRVAQFALVWWLTVTTGSAAVLATASLAAMLPQILLGPFAGTVVDRVRRRWLMIGVDFGIALVSGALGWLFYTKAIQVWHIYLAMTVRAVGAGFHWPAMIAATSLMVPERHLTRIAGLNQTMQGLLSILSPPLGALALSLLPMHGVMGIDIATFFIAAAPLLALSIPEVARPEAKRIPYFSDLLEGFRYVWSWRGLFLLLCSVALINFIALPMATLLPLMVKDYFGKGALELGWTKSAWGIGVVAGGLIVGIWGGFKKKIHTILLGVLGMGGAFWAIGFLPPWGFYLALGLLLLAGLMNPLTNAPFMSLIQSTVASGMQGRVLSLISSMVEGIAPLALLLAGPLADLFGVRFWYLVGGSGMILLGSLVFAVPAIIHLEDFRPGSPPGMEPQLEAPLSTMDAEKLEK
ncbi:MAG: MFS transporter [Candidatus Bipolaricaulia bacterium]